MSPYTWILALLAVLAFSGCNGSDFSQNTSKDYTLPEELKDCKLISMSTDLAHLYVMRCPNSAVSVTYPVGKSTATSITIDGVQYERKKGK